MTYKIVAVTPAGRRYYMDLLKHYILRDSNISEWHLWDNCRDPSDRIYIDNLEREHEKIHIVRIEKTDGTNLSVNKFYKFCDDPTAFYIKMDDDLVYIQEGMAKTLFDAASAQRDTCFWWSPLVINNALCSWLLQHHGLLKTSAILSAQAGCATGWRDPRFAVALHSSFLELLAKGKQVRIPNAFVSLSRFSINCLGFFGADVRRIGSTFCPPDVDDEEWLSASLPLKEGRAGCIVGATCVAHYSFFTQEAALRTTNILDRYYDLAGLKRHYPFPLAKRISPQKKIRRIARMLLMELGIKINREHKNENHFYVHIAPD